MTTKEAVERFTLKMLLLREWKWLLGIIITSTLWIAATYMSAAQTLSQVKINTPRIARLEEKCTENELYHARLDERMKVIDDIKIQLNRIESKIR